MAEKGTIISINGDKATVELDQASGCRRCGLCSPGSPGRMQVEVNSIPGLEVGQQVLIDGGPTAWLPALLLFVLPLVDLVIGVVVGQVVDIGLPRDVASAIFGGGLFVISFAGGAWCERSLRRRKPERPKIISGGIPAE